MYVQSNFYMQETWLYFMFIFIPSTGEALKDLKQHFLHLLDEMFRQFWLWHYSSLEDADVYHTTDGSIFWIFNLQKHFCF